MSRNPGTIFFAQIFKMSYFTHIFIYLSIYLFIIKYYLNYHENMPIYFCPPLKPYSYIIKLAFTEVYIIFLLSSQIKGFGYALDPPRRGGSNSSHNLCFEQKYEEYQNFLSENLHHLVVKFSVYLNRHVFVKKWFCFMDFIRRENAGRETGPERGSTTVSFNL